MKRFFIVLALYLMGISLFAFFQYSGFRDKGEDPQEEGTVEKENAVPEFKIPGVPDFEPEATLIGTWNLRLKPPPTFMRPGDFHDPLFIAQIIIDSGADLWALQELFDDYTDSAERLRNEYMDATILILNRRTGDEWRYWIGDAEDTWGQNAGFLWNSKTVEAVEGPFALSTFRRPEFALTERLLWKRRPAAGLFTFKETGTRIFALSAHHKGYNSETAQAHRSAEATLLLEQLPGLTDGLEVDGIVLLGRLADESEEPASLAYAKAGFRDLNPSDVPNLMSASSDGSVRFSWATSRILVNGLDSDIFPDAEQATLGDAWLAERETDLHNFIYYASNYLPLVTRVR